VRPRNVGLTLEQNFGFLYNMLILVGTEMIGYGLAGICRRWLVYPAEMLWPSTLADCTLLNTLHRERNYPVGRWTISRYRLFFVAMIVCFGYSFLPQFLGILEEIQIFNLIWPKSPIVNTLFGVKSGLALLPLTLSYQTVVMFLGFSNLNPELTFRVPSDCPSRRTFQYMDWNGILVPDRGRNHVCKEYLV